MIGHKAVLPRFLVACQLFLLGGLLAAQSLAPQPFPFGWKPVEGAGGYLVEVKDSQGNLTSSQQLKPSETSLSLQLLPGTYQIRLTTLNRFLKPESSTAWLPIHVEAPTAPEILSVESASTETGTGTKLRVDVNTLAPDATAALTSPAGQAVPLGPPRWVAGKAEFDVPPLAATGRYSLILTNPPGKAATADGVLTVHYPQAQVDGYQPRHVRLDTADQIVTLAGRHYSKEVTVVLQSSAAPTREIGLTLFAKDDSILSAVVPRTAPPGTYRLVVSNGPGEEPVTAGDFVIDPLIAPPVPPPVRPAIPGRVTSAVRSLDSDLANERRDLVRLRRDVSIGMVAGTVGVLSAVDVAACLVIGNGFGGSSHPDPKLGNVALAAGITGVVFGFLSGLFETAAMASASHDMALLAADRVAQDVGALNSAVQVHPPVPSP
jgi:hypothetical protein